MLHADVYADFVLLTDRSGNRRSLARVGTAIFHRKHEWIEEVIATEVEICIKTNDFFNSGSLAEFERLELPDPGSVDGNHLELPICFSDEHDDWNTICEHTGLSRVGYIEKLLECKLTIAMIGFLPGFVYLSGLPVSLHVPRKANPSKRTSANSFAIGGKYAGVYSLPSPAGWNVIGNIASQLLDTNGLPPMSVQPGETVRLRRIDESDLRDFVASLTTPDMTKSGAVLDEGRGTIQFEKPGLLTVLQDRGRAGLAYYAIPRGGAMDATAAELANSILGNHQDAVLIECHFIPPAIRFDCEATICLTGADMNWQVDGKKVGRNRTVEVASGSLLTGSSATDACRAYIAIRGCIDTRTTFGSSACYLPGKFGGNDGRPFAVGDRLQWVEPTDPLFPLRIDLRRKSRDDDPFIFNLGPEFDWLDDSSKRLIETGSFSVSMESDRMGARLNGPKLSTDGKLLSDSVPLLPGMIQLTPAGQCIVVLQDGQTTGGYPRIGYLNSRCVERLNQIPLGDSLRFEVECCS